MNIEEFIENAKFGVKKKSESTLFQEYEIEKWSSFEKFLKTKSSKLSLQQYLDLVEEWTFDDEYYRAKQVPVCFDGEVNFLEPSELQFTNYDLLLNEIIKVREHFDFTTIVELGSGLGNNLAFLSDHFPGVNFASREYSTAARRIQKEYLKEHIKSFSIDNFNMYSNTNNLKFENAICITSYVFSLIEKFPDSVMESLLNSGIRYVINLEPLFEVQDQANALEGKIREYIFNNNYNQDYYSKLSKFERMGRVEILNYQKNKYGLNPFFPASILTWKICNAV